MATPRKIGARPGYSRSGPLPAIPNTLWGENILSACDRRRISLRQLATKAGIGHSTLDRMLDGSSETSVQKLAFVAEALGFSLYQIVLPADQFEELL